MIGKPDLVINTDKGHLNIWYKDDRVYFGDYFSCDADELEHEPISDHDDCCPGHGNCCDRDHCDDYTCVCNEDRHCDGCDCG